jgi:hypothetical protein
VSGIFRTFDFNNPTICWFETLREPGAVGLMSDYFKWLFFRCSQTYVPGDGVWASSCQCLPALTAHFGLTVIAPTLRMEDCQGASEIWVVMNPENQFFLVRVNVLNKLAPQSTDDEAACNTMIESRGHPVIGGCNYNLGGLCGIRIARSDDGKRCSARFWSALRPGLLPHRKQLNQRTNL